MAQIEITCPECGNRRAVPDELVGKKIKCKKCQSVFTVKAAKAGGAAPAKGGASVIPIKEEEDGKNPYQMLEENLAARCPFCAQLLDPPDAKICIHCGYDMIKRRRVERKIVHETTAADYIVWHLPTAACLLVFCALAGGAIFLLVDLLGESNIASWCSVWLIVVLLFAMFFSGRFVFRRLIWHFHPPEHEKKVGEDEDYEDDEG